MNWKMKELSELVSPENPDLYCKTDIDHIGQILITMISTDVIWLYRDNRSKRLTMDQSR